MVDTNYSQSRSFNLGIAIELNSMAAAAIYDDLAYAQNVFGEGYFYRSDEQMIKRFPILSKNSIRRNVAKLAEAGWISTLVKKVDGITLLHYQIEKTLAPKMSNPGIPKMSNPMGIPKMSIPLIRNKETKKETKSNFDSLTDSNLIDSSFGAVAKDNYSAVVNDTTVDKAGKQAIDRKDLLVELIAIVNPREKATADRVRVLNGRLKDYTPDELKAAARALRGSQWHKENRQMSIDNLLAPSKFGRWHAQAQDTPRQLTPAEHNRLAEKSMDGTITDEERELLKESSRNGDN